MRHPGNFKWWAILFALALLPAPASHAAARLLRATGMTVVRGESNRVFVVLESLGNENAVGLSLCYDTNLLVFVKAARTTEATNFSASLNVTTNQTFRGRVGLGMALSPNTAFPAGSHPILEVTFRALADGPSVATPMSLCSLPIALEVVDVEAGDLGATYEDGVVNILGSCTYVLQSNAVSISSAGGSGAVGITAGTGCAWSIANATDWITITSGTSGTGNGTIAYFVSANFASTARTGLLQIAGQTFSVSQAASTCAYALSPTSRAHGSGSATNTVSMTASNGCAWSVSNTNSWITIRSAASGSGNGTVTYSVGANPDPMARTGLIQVDGQIFTVSQAAVVCSYKLSPTNRTHGSAAATNSIGVTASSGCSWMVANSNAWITITSSVQAQGTDNIDYEILANPSSVGRTGWITVEDQAFSVSQSGATCLFGIAPASGSYGPGSAASLVTVTATPGCAWAVINTNSWITMQPGASGTGNGSVGYTVSTNPGTTARSGVVRIASVSHPVTQAGIFICTYKLSVTNRTHGSGAASNAVTMTASNICAWTVVNTNTWITITSETNGAGDDSVTYAITANPNPTPRTGVVRVAGQSLTLLQQAAPCEFSISTSSRTHGFGAATNFVNLTTASGCAWTARTTNDWISIKPITNGTASATVNYTVTANPNHVQRTGVVMIAEELLTLIQRAAPCLFELSPEKRQFGSGMGTGLVTVITSAACSWSAENTNDWITIISATNGTGNGFVSYRVAANPTPSSRIGVLNIGGEAFTVTQTGPTCVFAIAPSNRMHGFGSESGVVSITTTPGCSWNVSDTNTWISLTSLSKGTNSGQVTYTVAANPTLSARTAMMVIAGQTFTVNQAAGPCTYKLSPVTRAHGSGAATNSVSVTTSNQCAWTIVNTNDWITISSAATRTGSTALTYGLGPNPGTLDRTGLVLIAEQTFVLIQSGATCEFSISASTRMHGAGAASNAVSLTTVAGCDWSVINTNDWITITSGTTGSSSAAVNYRVAANPTFAERTGAVMIADKVMTVIQHAAVCAFSITPGSRTHGSGIASNSVSLTTSNECAWTVVNTNAWLNLTSSSNGTGSAIVSYTLAGNSSPLARIGLVMIADETFTLVQSGVSCEISISPTNRIHGTGAATNLINLSTAAGCAWSVVNTNDWITMASESNGMGNATVHYTVAAHPSSLDRTGLVFIADQTFVLVQRGAACEFSISPAMRTHGQGAATNSITLATPAGCAWIVSNGNEWITIASASNGMGSTTVHYTAAANPSSLERTGLVVIASETFTLVQRGMTCEFSISPVTRMHGAGAASNAVSLTTLAICDWSVINTNDWITITSATAGNGSAVVSYLVAANPSFAERTGAVMVADKVMTVIQHAAVCAFSITPGARTHGSGIANNSVSLTTSNECAWTVVNTNTWLNLTSSSNGAGSAIVSYTLAGNASPLARTGLVMIADETFTLVQSGVSCEVSISPTNRMHGTGAATNSINLSTAAGCAWSVVNTNDWITMASESNGIGNATVHYTVAAHPSSLDRTGLVFIADQTFVLVQRGAACEFSISPAMRTHGQGAATNSITLATPAGCAWSVNNGNEWITIASASNGIGSTTVHYTAAANPSSLERTGLVVIAGETFTLVQRGVSCEISISPATRTHGAGAASNAVNLTTLAGCGWSVLNTNDWITITSTTAGSGNAVVSYLVAANPTFAERTGAVMVADKVMTVIQHAAVCAFSITPGARTHGSGIASNSVSLTTSNECAWTVVNTNAWLNLTSSSNGAGSAIVSYTLAGNASPLARTGLVMIADEIFTLVQSGVSCEVSISPTNRIHGTGAATNLINLTTAAGCAWSVVNTNDWITMASESNGMGNATVHYTVAAHPSSLDRTGLVFIADQTFVLVQRGAACEFSISPAMRTHGQGAATNSITLATPAGCAWSVSNGNEWINIASASNGMGSTTVHYTAAANPSSLERTGLVVIAGETFTLVQRGVSCEISISPATRTHGAGAASNAVNLTTLAGCGWSVLNTNDWITITSTTAGSGNAVVSYLVAANPTFAERTGAVMVADKVMTVIQHAAVCAFSITPGTRTHGSGIANNSVSLTTSNECAWTVVNTNAWLNLTSSSNGAGSAIVSYTLAGNASPLARTGLVMIADEIFTLVQSGVSCEVSISPTNRMHGTGAATNSINLSTAAGCAWAVVNTNDWITISSESSGTGNTSVHYAVGANSSPLQRTGLVFIADQTLALIQPGVVCEFSISPTNRTHGTGTASNSVSLTAAAGCAWSVVNSNDWITMTSERTTGSAILNYAVTANPASTERSGVVLIAGEIFTLTQRGAGCTLSLSPASRTHGFAGATNAVTLNTPGDCAWAIVNTNTWITITSATSGLGGASVGYAFAANPVTVDRTGGVSIGDQVLMLTQHAAPCLFDLTPGTRLHGFDAETGLVSVATSLNCPWSVVNTNAWITLGAPAAGTGNGSVAYAVNANPSPIPRTGLLTIGGELFRVSQLGIPCSFALSATSRLHEAGTETGAVSVITISGCSWTVNNPNQWIDIIAGAHGAGSGTVTYRVDANPSTEPRSGLLTIAGEILSVSQPGAACAYKLSPTNRVHGYGMVTGTVSVTAIIGCSWSVVNTNDWLTITSGTNGVGSGSVTYSVQANTAIVGRMGAVMIADQVFTIGQQGTPCTSAISPATRHHGHGGTTGTVSLTTLAGCAWQILNTNGWITVTSSLQGTGSASVSYTVEANASTLERTGVILVADQPLTVSQRGVPCQFFLALESVVHGAGSETGTVSLTAGVGCGWSVINTNDWLAITSPTEGTGNAHVTYNVAPNPSILAQTGVVMIAGQAFKVVQQGAPCTVSVSPASRTHGFEGATNAVTLNTPNDCAWIIVNTNEWITITSATSGSGGTSVGYALAANPITVDRTGVVTIDDQVLTLTQRGGVPSEAVKPIVAITSHAANARTTNSLLTGTARDNRGVTRVRIQVGDGPILIASGTNAWSINLAGILAPGTNVVRVQSMDSSGNESVMVTRRFVFVPTSMLTLRTSGTGSVTPNQHGRRLEVGRSYTIVATPGAGQVFSNWTGGVTAGNGRLTFVMRSNLVIEANFVPNPFRSIKGTYTGLFHPGQAEHARSGFLSLILTERGSFTATMLTGGRRLAFSGAFNLFGTTTNTVRRAGTNALVVELTTDLTAGGTQISGVVRDGIFEAVLMAARATFHPVTNPATLFAGKYTLILPATPDSTILPCGDGVGTVTVDRGGNVIFAGTLADGTPVAQRARLSPNGEWPLYAPLYAGKGSLLSGVTFTSLAMDDLSGQFRWTKPALPLAKYYRAGFDVPWTPMLGSRYTAPGTNRVLNITDGQVAFNGGNLGAPFTNHVTLSAGNKITNLDTNKLTLTFAPPTGLLSGTAAIPGAKRTFTFKGAVHQKRERASGFFLGTNQSGRVEFTR